MVYEFVRANWSVILSCVNGSAILSLMREERISVGPKEHKRAMALTRLLAGGMDGAGDGDDVVARGPSGAPAQGSLPSRREFADSSMATGVF